jgi:hypothetical protein
MNFGTIPHANESRPTGGFPQKQPKQWLAELLGALADARVAERDFIENRRAMREARR